MAKASLTHFEALYQDKIVKQLQDRFAFSNPMQVPKVKKIVLNIGLGQDAVSDSKVADKVAQQLTLIAGQKAVVTHAKKSIAGFKLREGMPLGCKVTLRGKRMFEFLERLVYIALPRVRDFRGLSATGFDEAGNYSFGLKEQIVFPEVDYDKIDKVRGMDVTLVTSARNSDEALALLEGFNLPFRKKNNG
jgi:large subunit ribosomal protein L5